MFRIETHVGAKYGGWKAGDRLYTSDTQAAEVAKDHTRAERQGDASRMTRRVVPA
jgi:hypothetical protein